MKTKSLQGVEVKDADKGLVTAVFATFNTIDKDGDVTLPGAFKDGTPVRISAFGHSSWGARGNVLPVGKGTVVSNSTEAILEGQFFMNTTIGKDHFEVVKAMGELQEWSYSVDPAKESYGDFEGKRVRFLEELKGPHEVSPVLAGAGEGTRTLDLKHNMRFPEEAEAVMAALKALRERTADVMAKRAEKGKDLGVESADLIKQVKAELALYEELLTRESDPGFVEDIRREHVKLLASLS